MILTQYFPPLQLCSNCSQFPRRRRGQGLTLVHTLPNHGLLPQICSQHEHRDGRRKPAALPCASQDSAAALSYAHRTFSEVRSESSVDDALRGLPDGTRPCS